MVATATFLSGGTASSYSSGSSTFTITWSSIQAGTSVDSSPGTDSIER
jgi:hypothetical protein